MASIHLKMGVDNAQFRTGLEQAKNKAEGFKKSVSKVMGGVLAVAGVGMAINKVMQGIDHIREKYDRLAKLTKQHGDINVKFFQRASFVAEQSGTNVEAVAKSMDKLLMSTKLAAEGSKMYVRAFDDLNINFNEFQKLDQEGKFKAIADATRDAADADKAKAAVLQIMGMRAGELIPMLKEGSKGFEEIAKSVHLLTKENLRDIEAFNDQINRMKTEIMTLAAQKLPPVLNQIMDYMVAVGELDKEGRGFWQLKGTFGIGGPDIRERISEKMEIQKEKRERKHKLQNAKEALRKNLNQANLPTTTRQNIISQIEALADVDKIDPIIQNLHDSRSRHQALQTQQEFFPEDAGKSSTLLNHMLGELQKINQSGIEVKGRGINDVQLSQEPTTNAFE
tara:strand:+ start:4773 stop:5954 length:1182 start_codon:yes stop_codon:yes gene_type:complete